MPFAILALLKSLGGSVVGFLSRLSLAQIVCILLTIALIVNVIRADHWKKVATARQAQVNALTVQLHSITTAKNTQKVITRDRIRIVTRTIASADAQARKIEQAPLPGGCKSPKEVLNADL